MTYIATFFTHYSAVRFYRYITGENIPAKKMPVPRRISSSCGTGVRFETELDVSRLANGDVDKIFRYTEDSCELVFENKED